MKTTTHQTELSANVVLLCRFLRKKSFNLTATEEADALNAVSYLPIHSENYFKEALRSVLTKSQFQQSKFDEYYHEFKDQLKKASDSKVKELPEKKPQPEKKTKAEQFDALKDWLNLSPSEEEKEIAAFSDLEVLTRKDFLDLSENEMQLMMRVLQKLARKMAHQKSRLRKKSKRRQQLDLKQTIRANMRKGGEIQQLVFSEKKNRKLKLVLLCDVSRSMDLYSRFFIHLIYAFQNAYDKIETLVFSTALHKVSEILDNNEFDKAFRTISERVPHWSGGTTIGSCLQDFTENYGHGMLDKKTMVLILSDGWDTGEPEVMKEAMKTIYKKSKKVIWLNPLAGNRDFSPESIGMQTALPYIDVLASAHNLESLKGVLQQLRSKRNLLNRQFN
ncbi:VWA domain-containing protein [Maribacter algarum]|uniref:VWA domain-containing protein n=1 Tax=Maribacter algarum (ex Zhang et al. 2020) TaxID=2578118 RepID=A0A5S3PQ66_9FLAO|nr:VWA domain-containing protein [Maribacter algarum]TMM56824.1 VWA domain-containing protein [Maribacter algarum]